MKQFEFQFVWGTKRHSFGIDIVAGNVDEAVIKANRYFNTSDEPLLANHPDIERASIHVATKVTAQNIDTIYGPLNQTHSMNYTVAQFRKLQSQRS
jgi:hypothetical protein